MRVMGYCCFLKPGYSKWGPWTSNGFTWELRRNAESQALFQTYSIKIRIFHKILMWFIKTMKSEKQCSLQEGLKHRTCFVTIHGPSKFPFKWLSDRALADVARWTECRPANWKVAGSICSRAHAWVAAQVPSWGPARGSQSMYLSHIDISLPLFLPPFPSL